VWGVALLSVSCFSPTYHNGNLRCTASSQCPKDYHCAVDYTCWRNGSNPDVGGALPDSSGPETTAAPEVGAETRDAAPDSVQMADLPAGAEVAVIDVPSLPDTVPPLDLPLGQDFPAPPPSTDALDAPATDAPAQADGPDTGNAEAASAGVGLDQLAAEYARVVCAKDFACCTQSDLKGKTLASCEQNITSVFQTVVQSIADGVGRGRTIYYPERASQCLQAIGAVSCQAWPMDPVTQLPAICENAIEPQVTSGGPCRSAAECVSRLCTGASSSADGACLPKAVSGEGCVQIIGQNSCERELYCDSTNKCSPTKVDGTSCTGNRECKSLTCLAAPDAGNICQPALCYSNGPLLPPACSFGGRPSAYAFGLALATLTLLLRRRQARSRR
jgi:hypothetical protein